MKHVLAAIIAVAALTTSTLADDGSLQPGKPSGVKQANQYGIGAGWFGAAIAAAIIVAVVVDKRNTTTSTGTNP